MNVRSSLSHMRVGLPVAMVILAVVLCFLPHVAGAHEVYVLTKDQINTGLTTPPFSAWQTLTEHVGQFMFWAFIGVLTVFLIFCISFSRVLEAALEPFLRRLRRFAPVVSRVTIGVSFCAAAYFQAVFGPELPLTSLFRGYEPFITCVLALIGVCIVFGFYTRFAALIALVIFSVAVYEYGAYMLTYANYLGEIIILFILGAHRIGMQAHGDKKGRGLVGLFGKIADRLAPYSFLILRVAFGISLLYASLYAKFFHNMLALQVASLPLAGHAATLAENLGGFEPHFLVLGAGIVELVIGLFFLLGIEIRFTALFLEFWLVLSLMYFGEVVWPHLILIGIPIAFIFYGYDKYSLEGFFFKNAKRKPVL